MSILGSFGARQPPAGARPLPGSPLALAITATIEGPIACAIDGSVENARELADSLGLDPSLPPERLIAEGFRRSGDGVFTGMRGAFVAIVWDSERRVGAIVRDRIGDRPLHFCTTHGGLLFASEVADLVALLPSRPPPDDAWMAHWIARRSPSPGLTPFAGVRRLPAGHAIRLEGERWTVAEWWPPRPVKPIDMSAAEAASELRAAMGKAVDRALEGARAPGVMLSGGFDSSSVAALAALERPLRVYSGVFPTAPEADESDRIAVVRGTLGLQGVEQSLHGGGALVATFEFIRDWGLPPASPNLFIWRALLRQAADDGTDVLLDGEGGDELFGCSLPLLADLLRRGRLVELLRLTRRVPGIGEHPPPRLLARALSRYALRGALPPRLHALARRRHGRPPRQGPPWLADHLRELLDDTHRDAWKRHRGPRWWARLVHAVGQQSDAIGAADHFRRKSHDVGVRLAHPWRDTELIDFVLRLPPEHAFDPKLDRPVAREAMRGLVPDAVRLAEAKPFFNAVLAEALYGPDMELVEELAGAPELAPYVHPDRVAEMLGRRDGPASPLDAWRMATVGAWLRVQSDPAALDGLLGRAAEPIVELHRVG